MNPYQIAVERIRQVMKDLITLMCDMEVPMPTFKNMAAVYVMWQAEYQLAQVAAMNWEMSHA